MSPVTTVLWDGVSWVGRGGSTPVDDFVLGVTIPNAENTGLVSDPSELTLWTGSTDIYGSSDANNPLVLEGYDFPNLMTWRGGYVRSYNCRFRGGPGSFDTGLLNMTGNYSGYWTADRCEFRPDSPSHYLNAVHGAHYAVTRSQVSRTVDGFGVINRWGHRVDVVIHGNYAYDFARFTAPVTKVVHNSDTKTHNDFVQLQYGIGLSVIGNAVHGYCKHFASPLAGSLGYDVYPDGSAPSGSMRFLDQGVLLQQNSGAAPAGPFQAGEYEVKNNWFWGTAAAIRPATTSLVDRRATYNIVVTGNRWMDMPRDWGSGVRYYTIRPTVNVTVNGVSYPPGNTNDAFDNKFDTNPDVLASHRGTSVIVRCDTE